MCYLHTYLLTYLLTNYLTYICVKSGMFYSLKQLFLHQHIFKICFRNIFFCNFIDIYILILFPIISWVAILNLVGHGEFWIVMIRWISKIKYIILIRQNKIYSRTTICRDLTKYTIFWDLWRPFWIFPVIVALLLEILGPPLQDSLEYHQEQLIMICQTFTSMVTPNKILHVHSRLLWEEYAFVIDFSK